MRPVRLAVLALVAALLATATAACTPITPPEGGTYTQVRYGPYRIPAAGADPSGHHGGMGMFETAVIDRLGGIRVPKPCRDCYLTGMKADLVDASGTVLNIADGLWLHHVVMFNNGADDLTCGRTNDLGRLGQRFFASGNERTAITFEGPYGYPVGSDDSWNLLVDLANLTAAEQTVHLAVHFTWVPKGTSGYRPVTPVWFDIDQCGDSEQPAKTGRYSYSWDLSAATAAGGRMPAGKLITIMGHQHDGGTNIALTRGDQVLCDSVATYGGDPAFREGPGSQLMPGMDHISKQSSCQGSRAAPVAVFGAADTVRATAHYDADAHMQMGTEPVMGIMVAYLDTATDA
jgi:hypothetical protein